MATTILMPALSPTMTEGKIARWLLAEGDTVRPGAAVCEIETDKATMEVEAVDEGILARILVPGGTAGVAVNTPIAIVAEEGETVGEASQPVAAPAAAAPIAAVAAAPAPPAPAAAVSAGGRVFASPLARRLAAQGNLDLATVSGSGPRGRIVKADVAAALAKPRPVAASALPAPVPTVAAPVAAPAPRAAAGGDVRGMADKLGQRYRLEPNSTTRKTIARRLTESKQTIPHFYLSADCQVDELLRVRAELNRAGDVKLSVNDFVVRAVAIALRRVPTANSTWTDEAVLLFDQADVAVAVASPTGLITPVVKGACGKGLATIAAEIKDLAGRARDGKLKPEEYQGGTFTVSNLGMFGVRSFSAIINPPQACLLAVGAAEQRPIVKDGALAVATVMTCTLSVDHRAVDGAVGAEFLKVFRGLIENPLTMLL